MGLFLLDLHRKNKMPLFNRFVQIGRVCTINYGEDVGKHCVIIDVLDNNKALVHGVTPGFSRQLINFKRLNLTDCVLKISRSASSKSIKKAVAEDKVEEKLAQSNASKRNAARAAKANRNDFDRFKDMVANKSRQNKIRCAFNKAKKAQK